MAARRRPRQRTELGGALPDSLVLDLQRGFALDLAAVGRRCGRDVAAIGGCPAASRIGSGRAVASATGIFLADVPVTIDVFLTDPVQPGRPRRRRARGDGLQRLAHGDWTCFRSRSWPELVLAAGLLVAAIWRALGWASTSGVGAVPQMAVAGCLVAAVVIGGLWMPGSPSTARLKRQARR